MLFNLTLNRAPKKKRAYCKHQITAYADNITFCVRSKEEVEDHLGQGPKDEGIRPGGKQEINADGDKRSGETANEPTDANDRGTT